MKNCLLCRCDNDDVDAQTWPALVLAELTVGRTPDWQPMGYRGAHTNLTATVVSFFNPEDGILPWWRANQLFKPVSGYSYDGTNCWYIKSGTTNLVTDSQESRAMIARSRTLPLGMLGPAPGQTNQGVIRVTVNLNAQFGFKESFEDHSAFFARPVQTVRPYYRQLLTSCGIQVAP